MHVTPFLKFRFLFLCNVEATSTNWTQKTFFLLSTYTVSKPAIPSFQSQLYQ